MYFTNPFAGSFGIFPNLFSIFFVCIFAIVIIMIVYRLIQGVAQFHRNNESPNLTVDCQVVAKRTNIRRYHHHTGTDNAMHCSNSTDYYVTFQVESGDRMELSVSGREYGLLAEGDRGRLTFQGTRYKGFERNVMKDPK